MEKRNNRTVIITPNYLKHPEGSCLIETGDTKVICTATVENRVNDWMKGKGRGWVTAEYAMLPRANASRNKREGQFGRWPSSRSQEIQRLIARSLRAAVWPARLGEKTIIVDCDVIQADGGTRTASITGGFVAMVLALNKLVSNKQVKSKPLKRQIAATSVGIVKGELVLDLCYDEDSNADVDMNIAADQHGNMVEAQGTGEGSLFTKEQLNDMTELGLEGIDHLINAQRQALEKVGISLDHLLGEA